MKLAEKSSLQDRVDRLRNGEFLGVPIDGFERGGREQLIFLLMHGLTPTSKVLDLGCGILRAGYWLIHFLESGHYCGLEPSAERLAVGTDVVLEPGLLTAKRPWFDTNANFNTEVFGEKFDDFLAYSIWTHASKRQIGVMLDEFDRLQQIVQPLRLRALFERPVYRGGARSSPIVTLQAITRRDDVRTRTRSRQS